MAEETEGAEVRQIEQFVKEQEEREKLQPIDEEGDSENLAQHAGHMGTLKEWEESEAGKAFIEATGGEPVLATERRGSKRRSTRR